MTKSASYITDTKKQRNVSHTRETPPYDRWTLSDITFIISLIWLSNKTSETFSMNKVTYHPNIYEEIGKIKMMKNGTDNTNCQNKFKTNTPNKLFVTIAILIFMQQKQ